MPIKSFSLGVLIFTLFVVIVLSTYSSCKYKNVKLCIASFALKTTSWNTYVDYEQQYTHRYPKTWLVATSTSNNGVKIEQIVAPNGPRLESAYGRAEYSITIASLNNGTIVPVPLSNQADLLRFLSSKKPIIPQKQASWKRGDCSTVVVYDIHNNKNILTAFVSCLNKTFQLTPGLGFDNGHTVSDLRAFLGIIETFDSI